MKKKVEPKKDVGIWLDKEKAYIISIFGEEEKVQKIESEVETRVRFPGEKKSYSRLGNMFVNPAKRKTKRQKQQLHHYFEEIINNVTDADEIMVFGPSDTKKHFEKEILTHKSLSPKFKGVQSADNISERQMIAKVKEFYDLK